MSLGVQEKRQLRISKELRTKTVNNLWKITEELNILYRENWTALADREMIKFQNELLSGMYCIFIFDSKISDFLSHHIKTSHTTLKLEYLLP